MNFNLQPVPLTMKFDSTHQVTSIEQLEDIYASPAPRSITKEIDYISAHYQAYIEKAPFAIVATSGPGGLDCSPRGDPSGFVRVQDTQTILMPDRRGNNRLDSLRNLIDDNRIALLFIIPGLGQTLRVNGRAKIVTDPTLRESFTMRDDKVPATVLVITVERVYFQCPKALVRAKLWDIASHVDPAELPTTGAMLAALSEDNFDSHAYDEGYPAHMEKTIY